MELRDPVCSLSHLLTAVWAAYATLVLIRFTPPKPGRRLAVGVFGLSMVLLYSASGIFHGVPYTRAANPAEFRFFQLLDQSAIYLLIAGTNTPLMVVLLGGSRGRRHLWMMWGLAAAGVACLWLLPKAPHEVIVALCLGMGWLGVVPIARYSRAVGWRAMGWVGMGAGAYTIGAVCELVEWPSFSVYPIRFGYHEVFHLCDIVGSLGFFLFISRHVVRYEKPAEEMSAERDEKPELAAADA